MIEFSTLFCLTPLGYFKKVTRKLSDKKVNALEIRALKVSLAPHFSTGSSDNFNSTPLNNLFIASH